MPKFRHGSGSVYKRGKTFWLSYYVKGERVRESADTADKPEARRKLQEKLGEIATGRFTGPAANWTTFEELIEGLLTDYQVNGKKSLPWVRIKVEKHLTPFFAGRKAHDITPADVKAFIRKRQEAKASNGEINRELSALKRAFNLGLQTEKIVRKPYIPRLEENNVRRGFFEPWEFDALVVKIPDHLRPPLTFAY